MWKGLVGVVNETYTASLGEGAVLLEHAMRHACGATICH